MEFDHFVIRLFRAPRLRREDYFRFVSSCSFITMVLSIYAVIFRAMLRRHEVSHQQDDTPLRPVNKAVMSRLACHHANGGFSRH